MTPIRTPLLCVALMSLLAAGSVHAKVWISEFEAANTSGYLDRDGDAEDWLELYNDASEAVNLAGWSLTDDPTELRKWIIPDVSLPADGSLVIFASGENRRLPEEELHTNFSLSKSGEYLGLIRADGVTVEHHFAPAYPGQFEDISYGPGQIGATAANVLPMAAAGRAGVPASAADFAAEFAGWNSEIGGAFTGSTWRAVSSGVGYDQSGNYGAWLGAGGDFEAELFNQSGSIFLRLPFTVTDPAAVSEVTLRMRWNDGFVAYLNGTKVAANRDPETPEWDSLATSERGEGENDDWISFPIDLSQVTLVAGENLLAIQGMKHAVDSPSLLILPELDITSGGVNPGGGVYYPVPTPGTANGAGATNLPPLLTEVTPRAEQPTGGPGSPPLVITAKVRDTVDPISEVRLSFRRMFFGEATVMMTDDGSGPDMIAGDGVFSAEIPTTSLSEGEMLRWRVEAEDEAGRVSRDPAYEDTRDSDRYYGTVALDPRLASSQLPVLHTFVQDQTAVNQRAGTRVSVYYLGEFYDNVQMDLHGQSTANFPKKSYDLDFNRGNRFLWKEGERKVKDINLLTNWADKSKVRNTMGYEFLKRCGTPYHFAFPVRVERNGAFFSVADMVEDGDDRYLDRVGLDGNGALYKMYDRMENASAASKKTRKDDPIGSNDLAQLIARLAPSQSVDARRRSAYDMVNIPATVNYLASLTVGGITDVGHKNYYMYRDTEGTGEWQPLPWDVDLSAGRQWNGIDRYFDDTLFPDYWNNANIVETNRLWNLMHNAPEFRDMFLRRVATLREQILLTRTTPAAEDWYSLKVRELEALMDPSGVQSDADLDYAKWGSWGNNYQMRQAAERLLRQWLPARRNFMFQAARNQGGVPVPPDQPAVPNITIEEIDVNPASGNQDHEYFILKNREAASVDLSGWTVSGAVDFVIPPGTVIPAGAGDAGSRYVGLLHVARVSKAFRTRPTSPRGGQFRLVVGGYDGQLSARGETIELRTADGALVASETYPGDPSPAQQYLRITELYYHPSTPTPAEEAALPGVVTEDFEWMELMNVGPVPLDLEGVRFTDGIDYTFGAGVLLDPGKRLILARNPAAFALRNPSVTATVLGPYTGLLDNDGEKIRLVDAVGENVLSFDYNDRWYPSADGGGRSLVLRDESIPWNQFGAAATWGISLKMGGSAGFDDPAYFVHFNAWQESEFDPAEREDPMVGTALANPDGDPYPNWQEYAFGLDPRSPDQALFTTTTVENGGVPFLGATARRRAQASDLVWDLQRSFDGQEWTTTPHVVAATTPHLDGTETWTVREAWKVGSSPQRLVRLRVRWLGGE